jgi:hypothetical protein
MDAKEREKTNRRLIRRRFAMARQAQMDADRFSSVASVAFICVHQRSSAVGFYSCPFAACPTKHSALEGEFDLPLRSRMYSWLNLCEEN